MALAYKNDGPAVILTGLSFAKQSLVASTLMHSNIKTEMPGETMVTLQSHLGSFYDSATGTINCFQDSPRLPSRNCFWIVT
jgi:hypothetical protein